MSTKTAKHAAPKVTLRVNPSGGIGVRPGPAKAAPAPARAASPRPPRAARGSDSRLLAGTVAGILLATGVLTLTRDGENTAPDRVIASPEDASGSVLLVGHGRGCAGSSDHQGANGSTGFAIAPEYAMTAGHVVEDSNRPTFDGHDATVVLYDGRVDLAVLHVPGLDAAPLEFSDAGKGDVLTLAGFGGHPKLREAKVKGHRGADLLIEDSPSVPGDSGGPWLTEDGKVAGVNWGIDPEDRSLFDRLLGRDKERLGHATRGDVAADVAAEGIGRTEAVSVPGCRS